MYRLAPLLVLGIAACAHADGHAALYGLTTTVSPEQLSAGAKATVAFDLTLKPGARISDGSPMRASISAQNLSIDRCELDRADAAVRPDGARFLVPVTALQQGPAPLDADLTFYLCTETICELQSRHVNVPLFVE